MTRKIPRGKDTPWRTGSKAWRELVAQVYAEETHCYLCGFAVDTSGAVNYLDDWAPNVDHVIPPEWALFIYGDDRGLDRSNVHLTHRACNLRKGMGPPPAVRYPPPPGTPPTPLPTASRDW